MNPRPLTVQVAQFGSPTHVKVLPLAAGVVVAAARAHPVGEHLELQHIDVWRRDPEQTAVEYGRPDVLGLSV